MEALNPELVQPISHQAVPVSNLASTNTVRRGSHGSNSLAPTTTAIVLTVASMLCAALCASLIIFAHRRKKASVTAPAAKAAVCKRRPAAEGRVVKSCIPQSAMNPNFVYVLPPHLALVMGGGSIFDTESLPDRPWGGAGPKVPIHWAIGQSPSEGVHEIDSPGRGGRWRAVSARTRHDDGGRRHGAGASVLEQRRAITDGCGAESASGGLHLRAAGVSAPVAMASAEGRRGEALSAYTITEEAGGTIVLSPFDSSQQSTQGSCMYSVGPQNVLPVNMQETHGTLQQHGGGAVVSRQDCISQAAISPVYVCPHKEMHLAQEEATHTATALPGATQSAQLALLRRLNRQLCSFGERDRFLGRFEILGRQHRRSGGVFMMVVVG